MEGRQARKAGSYPQGHNSQSSVRMRRNPSRIDAKCGDHSYNEISRECSPVTPFWATCPTRLPYVLVTGGNGCCVVNRCRKPRQIEIYQFSNTDAAKVLTRSFGITYSLR
jgi:hypothetical protein